MSASTDRRVARLVGRIAEERAARGRTAISHMPRIARTFSVDVFEPPVVQGGEAKLAKVINTLSTQPTRQVRLTTRSTVFAGPFEAQTFDQDTQPGRVFISMTDPRMIDYAEIADGKRRPTLSETKKPDEPEITLVDRLFAGW